MVSIFSRKTKESAKMPIPTAPQAPSSEPPRLTQVNTIGREDDLEGNIEETEERPKMLEPEPRIEKPSRKEILDEVEGSIPPVFIKIEKYGEVVKNVQRLKSFALGLRDALDALSDIEKELNTGLTLANRALDNFNTAISVLDTKFLRVAGTNVVDKDEKVPDELDTYVKDVYDQMSKLKHELKSISNQ